MKNSYLECGKIINTHGTDGKVKLESYCDSPQVLASLPYLLFKNGTEYEKRAVLRASVFREFVLMKLAGVETMDDAIALKGQTVYTPRENIPLKEGAYFVADLIGLPLLDAESGRCYGKVKAVESMPASDIYTVLTPGGKEVLFPAVKPFLIRIDTEKGIFVSPISGMFEEEDGHAV